MGNAIVVCVTGSNTTSSTTLSLSDTEGNSYTCALCNGYSSGTTDVLSNPVSNNIPSGTAFVSIWVAANITGGSSFKITATWGASGASSSLDISAAEVSGLGSSATVDVTQAASGSSTGNPATGSFSTTNANDIILVAMGGTSSSTGDSITGPSGFTEIGQFTIASTGKRLLSFYYKIVSSTQSSINPAFTTSSVSLATAIAVAYEQAASAPPTPTGLAVTNDSTNPTTVLDISWNSSSGATSYNLLQSSTKGGTYSTLQTGISGTSTTVTGLTAGTEYAFEVEAVGTGGTSAASSGVAWATEPAAPTSISPGHGTTGISISFSPPTIGSNIGFGDYAYRYEHPVGAANWTSGSTSNTGGGGNGSPFNLSSLTPDTQYGLEMATVIDSTNSDWSGTIQGPWSSEATFSTYDDGQHLQFNDDANSQCGTSVKQGCLHIAI